MHDCLVLFFEANKIVDCWIDWLTDCADFSSVSCQKRTVDRVDFTNFLRCPQLQVVAYKVDVIVALYIG